MKKIITLATIFATLAIFTGCTPMDKPSPLDTRAGQGQMGTAGNSGLPTSVYGDDSINPEMRGGGIESGVAGMDLDNPNPQDVVVTVYFGFDQYAVGQSERAKVQQAAQELKANEALKIVLAGHTDWYGTEEYNLALSEKRAAAVLSYLTELGIDQSRAETVGRGKNGSTPNVGKTSAEAKNDRRVDIIRIR